MENSRPFGAKFTNNGRDMSENGLKLSDYPIALADIKVEKPAEYVEFTLDEAKPFPVKVEPSGLEADDGHSLEDKKQEYPLKTWIKQEFPSENTTAPSDTKVQHPLTKTSKKPFACGRCEKKFAFMGKTYKKHMKEHQLKQQKKPLACNQCNKRFALSSKIFMKHLKEHGMEDHQIKEHVKAQKKKQRKKELKTAQNKARMTTNVINMALYKSNGEINKKREEMIEERLAERGRDQKKYGTLIAKQVRDELRKEIIANPLTFPTMTPKEGNTTNSTTYVDMIVAAIQDLSATEAPTLFARKGLSRQLIYKYISHNYKGPCDEDKLKRNIRHGLERGCQKGILAPTTQSSFKLGPKYKEPKENSKKLVPKKMNQVPTQKDLTQHKQSPSTTSALNEHPEDDPLNFSYEGTLKTEPGLDIHDHQEWLQSALPAFGNCTVKSELWDPLECNDKENLHFEEDIKSLHTHANVDSQELAVVGNTLYSCTMKMEPDETSEAN